MPTVLYNKAMKKTLYAMAFDKYYTTVFQSIKNKKDLACSTREIAGRTKGNQDEKIYSNFDIGIALDSGIDIDCM